MTALGWCAAPVRGSQRQSPSSESRPPRVLRSPSDDLQLTVQPGPVSPAAADEAQASPVRHRRRQGAAGSSTHGGQRDGVLQREESRECRVQDHGFDYRPQDRSPARLRQSARMTILDRYNIGGGAAMDQPEQSTATARAAQTSRIRVSRNRPNRVTRIPIETLSTESRFTAEARGTGSSPGSGTTSLTSPRIVVVHGATSARRWRGITASRDRTTTGRRPISAISHHQSSPRAGTALKRLTRPVGTTPSHPIHLARRAGARHRRRSLRRPRRNGSELAEQSELRPPARRPSSRTARCALVRAKTRPPSCSGVCESCHYHATDLKQASGCNPSGRGSASGDADSRVPHRHTSP